MHKRWPFYCAEFKSLIYHPIEARVVWKGLVRSTKSLKVAPCHPCSGNRPDRTVGNNGLVTKMHIGDPHLCELRSSPYIEYRLSLLRKLRSSPSFAEGS